MTTAFTSDLRARIDSKLGHGDEAFAKRFALRTFSRSPVHVVYGGAHLFRHDATKKLGAIALRSLAEHAADGAAFAAAFTVPEAIAGDVRARVVAKLETEPVEDFRIDFEDGYGVRSDSDEDAAAIAAAREVAKGLAEKTLPPFFGIRPKALAPETRVRALRTLELFATTLAEHAKTLPPSLVVTLPKVTRAAEVDAAADLCDAIEASCGFREGALRLEVMIETAQCFFDEAGRFALPAVIDAARGRLDAAHLGAYDLTASLGVAANHQQLDHPACDFARQMMLTAFAGTGVAVADGATTTLPVPLHRGAALDAEQARENRAAFTNAWKIHARNIRRSLAQGFWRSWDLHPAQLPARFAVTYAFFREAEAAAATRLRGFVEKAAQATLAGTAFDDAATGQGLVGFFLQGLASGALDEAAVVATLGVTKEALATRSFAAIAAAFRARE